MINDKMFLVNKMYNFQHLNNIYPTKNTLDFFKFNKVIWKLPYPAVLAVAERKGRSMSQNEGK